MSQTSGYYQNQRPEVAVVLPKSYTKVLEIGCGEGRFAENLSPSCEYWGIEPNPDVAERASARLHKVLIGTYLEKAHQLPDAYFDLVVCNDVIEHMDDHDRFLQHIRSKMTPSASLVGSIPNVRYCETLFDLLIKKDWRYVDEGILDRTHLRFFTKKSLVRTFSVNGMVIEELRGINSGLRAPTSFKRLVKTLALLCSITLTLSYYADIRFPQFAFRVRLTAPRDAG